MRSKGEPTASGDTDRPCSKKAPSYTYTFAGNGRIHSAVNHKDGQRSPKWLLKMSPLLSLLTQIRSVELRAWWQLWLHCHSYLHANYHLVFCDYLMNSGGKVVPLRKMKLPQKFMTKEKHKSLPARAWIANVLTQPTASSQQPPPSSKQTSGSSSVFPPRSRLLISHLLAEDVCWIGAGCCSWSCMAVTRLPQRSCESWPAMGEKDSSLGFSHKSVLSTSN